MITDKNLNLDSGERVVNNIFYAVMTVCNRMIVSLRTMTMTSERRPFNGLSKDEA
jgi:hypothetical protein